MNFLVLFKNFRKKKELFFCGHVVVFNKVYFFVVVVYVSMLIREMRNG